MKRIYRVEYEEKWTGCRDWISGHTNVLGNGDAKAAIGKARKLALKQSFYDDGKLQKCVGFRMTGVSVVAEAEI